MSTKDDPVILDLSSDTSDDEEWEVSPHVVIKMSPSRRSGALKKSTFDRHREDDDHDHESVSYGSVVEKAFLGKPSTESQSKTCIDSDSRDEDDLNDTAPVVHKKKSDTVAVAPVAMPVDSDRSDEEDANILKPLAKLPQAFSIDSDSSDDYEYSERNLTLDAPFDKSKPVVPRKAAPMPTFLGSDDDDDKKKIAPVPKPLAKVPVAMSIDCDSSEDGSINLKLEAPIVESKPVVANKPSTSFASDDDDDDDDDDDLFCSPVFKVSKSKKRSLAPRTVSLESASSVASASTRTEISQMSPQHSKAFISLPLPPPPTREETEPAALRHAPPPTEKTTSSSLSRKDDLFCSPIFKVSKSKKRSLASRTVSLESATSVASASTRTEISQMSPQHSKALISLPLPPPPTREETELAARRHDPLPTEKTTSSSLSRKEEREIAKREKLLEKERQKQLKQQEREEAKRRKIEQKERAKRDETERRQQIRQASGKFAKQEIAILVDGALHESELGQELVEGFKESHYLVVRHSVGIGNCIQWARQDFLAGGAEAAVESIQNNDGACIDRIEYVAVVFYKPTDFLSLLERKDTRDNDYPLLLEWLENLKRKSAFASRRIVLILHRVLEELSRQWKKRRLSRGDDYTFVPTEEALHDSIAWLLMEHSVDCRLTSSTQDLTGYLLRLTTALAERPFQRQMTELQCIRKLKSTVDSSTADPHEIVKDCWIRQLQQIQGISENKAQYLAQFYPTPRSLWDAYQGLTNEDDKRTLLQTCIQENRNSAKVSGYIYRLMTSTDPDELVV